MDWAGNVGDVAGFIPEDEWLVLTELSYFFRVLCAKELSPGVLEEMDSKDSVEEYELPTKQGGGYPGFISWFKQTVNSIRQFHFIR